VDRTCRDQQLLADLRVMDLASDLEFHLTFQHNDQLIRAVRKVFPRLARRVRPKVAAEPTGCPVVGHLIAIHGWHV
jgi:hypothetical protein